MRPWPRPKPINRASPRVHVANITRGLQRILYPVVRFMDRITWVVLFGMMLMTMIDVLLRKFFNQSILGTVEITELLMAVAVFCSIAECQVNEDHIKVDLVVKKLSPRVLAAVDTLTQGACFILFGFITTATFRHADAMRAAGEVTLDLGIPIYPFVYVVSFGCALLTLVLLLKALIALGEVLAV
jgi:TRAP-type transport system small permease protein